VLKAWKGLDVEKTSLCTRTRLLSQAQADLDSFKSDGKESPTGSAAKTLAPPGQEPPTEQAEQAAVPAAPPSHEPAPSADNTPQTLKQPSRHRRTTRTHKASRAQ
jgi:hypothetical protein